MRRVAVIGPGRVGTVLAVALGPAGYEVQAVAGGKRESQDAFVARVPSATVRALPESGRGMDLVVVAVPDDALAAVVREVAAADGVEVGSRWIHVSGGHGLEALKPASLAGAAVAACHPAQTFPDVDRGLATLPGTTWAVTASEADLGWARVLVTDLRGSPVTVPNGARRLYHAGLSVGSNATASVVTLARELLLGAGIGDPAAFLGPLVSVSAGNALTEGAAALTGPVRRGDAGTVAAHLEELRSAMPEAVEPYVALGRLALAYARRSGLDPERAEAIAALLGPAAPGSQGGRDG